jgi:phosphoribosylglycinamide formyltransferase-1
MVNAAVFGSGRGSNFQAILTAIDQGTVHDVTISLVLSNNSTSGILDIARAHHIPAMQFSQRSFSTEGEYVDALLGLLGRYGIDCILLAGYMKQVPPEVVARYRGRILNIHPALLPKFGGPGMYGMRVHEAVLAAGERESGATVHFVDEEYDHGAILLQDRVPVLPGDTPEQLAARVLKVEHRLFPQAVNLLAARIEHRQSSATV